MFTPSNMLKNYLDATPRDMYDIIGALMGYINADPAFKTNDFDDAVDYVLKYGISKEDLFSEFDPELDFEEDSAKWNEEYYSYARVCLKDNFSEKRIKHVKDIARKLNPDVVTRTGQGEQMSISKPNSTFTGRGELQSNEKKTQGQQRTNRKGELPIMQEHHNVKTPALIVIVVLVSLALVIAAIIFLNKNKTDAQSAAANVVQNYKSSIIKTQGIADILGKTM